MKKSSLIRPACFLAGLAVAMVSIASSIATAGTTYTWNQTAAGGNWNDSTINGWNSAGYPGSAGDLTPGSENDIADLMSKNYSGNATVSMNGVNAFLSELDLGSTSGTGWKINATGGGSITFKAQSGTAVLKSQNTSNGTFEQNISAPVQFASDTNITVTAPANKGGYLALTGTVSGSGNLTINTPDLGGNQRGIFYIAGTLSGYSGTLNFDATGTSSTVFQDDRVGLLPSSVNAHAMSVNLTGPTNLGRVGIFTIELGALNGTGGFIHTYTDTVGPQTLKVGYKNNPVDTFDGVLSGNVVGNEMSFEKAGSGTQILGGDNDYAGTTTVTGGKLIVNGSHTGGAAYTVSNNATLGGRGSIGSMVNLAAGSTIAPGASAGMLTVDSLSVTTGANFAFELDPFDQTEGNNFNGNDLLVINGALSLDGGVVNLDVRDSTNPGGEFGGSGTWTLEKFASLTGLSTPGTYDLSDFVTVNVTGLDDNIITGYTINANIIDGGSGTITLTTVPEPHTLVLAVLGLVGVAGCGLRKRIART